MTNEHLTKLLRLECNWDIDKQNSLFCPEILGIYVLPGEGEKLKDYARHLNRYLSRNKK